ncbi:MAG TPA: J domain-containing protein [Leptolyngbyaceae cyanobacterium]
MPEPDTPPKSYYHLLGIKPTASAQQIRRAYRDLSKLYHPDTTELPAEVATDKFQQLNEAYATLSSPERRWTYDQQMGYSRISVIQPPADLNIPASTKRREYRSNAYLDPNDRPLSAGEIFALFILGLTFVACLALVVTISLTQGETALVPLRSQFSINEELPAESPSLEEIVSTSTHTRTVPPTSSTKQDAFPSELFEPSKPPSAPAKGNSLHSEELFSPPQS